MVKVLHLLASGGVGGIESLCVNIHKYGTLEHQFCFFWQEGVHAQRLRQNGARVYFLDTYEKGMRSSVEAVLKICGQEKIGAVVVHHASPLMWIAGAMAQKRYPLKLYLYAHSSAALFLGVGTRSCQKQKLFFHWAKKHAEKLIAISEFTAQSLVEYAHVKKQDIRVIYNGIDNTSSGPPKEKKKNGKPQLVYCGRLVPEKGVDYLLRAVNCLSREERPECRIIGDGEQRTCLEELCRELGLEKDVVFTGMVEEVRPLLRAADILVHPVLCEEGFGLGVVEAMAEGVVCIAFEKGGLPEIIKNGENGFLVKDISYQVLAESIRQAAAIRGTAEFDRISGNAVRTAGNFTIRQMLQQLEGLIKEGQSE